MLERSHLHLGEFQRVRAFKRRPNYRIMTPGFIIAVDAVQVAGIAVKVPPAGFEFLCTAHGITCVVVLVFSAEHRPGMPTQIITSNRRQAIFLNC